MLIRPEMVKVVTWIAQNIVSKRDKLLDFLQYNTPDLVILNKTWLKQIF